MTTFKKTVSTLFAFLLSVSLACMPAAAFAVDLDEADSDARADSDYDPDFDFDFDDEDADADDADDEDSDAADAAGVVTYILDDAALLSANTADTLDERAADLASSEGVGVYFATVDSLQGSSVSTFADNYYKENDLGVGKKKSAVLCLVCIPERAYYVQAYGGATSLISKPDLSTAGADVNSYLGRDDPDGAAETYYDDVEHALTGESASSTAASGVSYTKGSYVIDDYGLLTDSQRSTLESKAAELAQQYEMGVYLLIVSNMGSMSPSSTQRTNFATSYYRQNNLGLGSGKDGIMLVLAVDSRDYVTVAYGQGSYSFSDEGISAMESAVTDELHGDNWYEGAENYYEAAEEQLAYYAAQGKPWTEPDPFSFLIKILAILGIPGIVAGSVVNGEKAAMKTAREKSEASNYLDRSSLVMRESTDQFVNTTLVATPRPKHEDSGGSGFGGGGWGGGGGGGFSSSGGGKF